MHPVPTNRALLMHMHIHIGRGPQRWNNTEDRIIADRYYRFLSGSDVRSWNHRNTIPEDSDGPSNIGTYYRFLSKAAAQNCNPSVSPSAQIWWPLGSLNIDRNRSTSQSLSTDANKMAARNGSRKGTKSTDRNPSILLRTKE